MADAGGGCGGHAVTAPGGCCDFCAITATGANMTTSNEVENTLNHR